MHCSWVNIPGWLLVLTSVLLAPRLCPAQMMVRSTPGDAQMLDDSDLHSASADERVENPLFAVSSVAQERLRVEATNPDALVREYVEKAGPVGPRKWFSATNFQVGLRMGVVYDDNILLSSAGPRRSDTITSVAGEARLSLGDFADRINTFAVVGYTGTGSLFANYSEEDSYDQDALLDLYYRRRDVAVGSSSVFQERHDATIDLGQRVDRKVYGEDFTVRYFRNDRTTISAALHYDYADYDTPVDTSTLTLNPALDYVLNDKVTVGGGVVLGRLTATGGVEEYSGEAQFRLGYTITQKVAATGSVGLEYRARGGEAGDSLTPVFAATGKWTPRDGTTLSLEGYRRTEASGALEGEDFVSTGVRVDLRQNLFQRIYARLSLGYQNASYRNVTQGESAPRSDNYFSIRGAMGYDFVRWLQIYAFYEHRQNDSTGAGFSFTSNRVGMEAAVIY